MLKTILFLYTLSFLALFSYGQELYVDMSKVPQGKWTMDYEQAIPGIPVTSKEKKLAWVAPAQKPLPPEWAKVKSFEEEGHLPTLSISKKQLETEGTIIPLAELMKESDPKKLDKKAIRRSLLHYALTKAQMAEVSHQPVNMKRFHVPGASEILEHYGPGWGDRKRHQWLVADILVIEYMQSRPEKHWRTGALCGANEIVGAISLEKLGGIKDTFPVGAAIAHLYMVPNLPYAVPQDYGSQQANTPQEVLMNLSSLYRRADVFPKLYPDLYEKLLAIEQRIDPTLANIHIETIAEDYKKNGDPKTALRILKRYEPRALDVEPTNKRIRQKIVELEKQTKSK